jgi:hypothetical protein
MWINGIHRSVVKERNRSIASKGPLLCEPAPQAAKRRKNAVHSASCGWSGDIHSKPRRGVRIKNHDDVNF